MKDMRIKKQCILCKSDYLIRRDRSKKSKYCPVCWKIRGQIMNFCLFCGKSINTTKVNNKVYCNKNCRNLHYVTRLKGENSPAWKGGRTSWNKKMRTRKAYRAWRDLIFERDDYKCVSCGAKSKKGLRVELNAHHIKHLSEYPEKAYDVDNGITLCKPCHLNIHHNPIYCQLIIDRWENFTGRKAEKVN